MKDNRTIQQLREQRAAKLGEADRILKADGSFDDVQRLAAEAAIADAEKLGLEIRRREAELETTARTLGTADTGIVEMGEHNGKPVHLLSKGASVADWVTQHGGLSHDAPHPKMLSLGKFLRGKVTGNWSNADAEHHLSQTESNDTAGGILVPQQFSARIIDKARAVSVLAQAGVGIIPMSTDNLLIATVAEDPTLEHKAELAAFTGTNVVFGGRELTARTWGNTLTISRELWDDAPNVGTLLEQTLSRALAAKLDSLGLNGTGSNGQPTGLANWGTAQGIGETGSVGAVTWEDFAVAVRSIQDLNLVPTAMIVSPKTQEDISLSTTGDGSTAAKQWLGAPPTVTDLLRLVTTACPDANAFIGDFQEAAFGVRLQPEIKISETAGDSFGKFAVMMRIVWRGTFTLLRPQAFHRLAGITH